MTTRHISYALIDGKVHTLVEDHVKESKSEHWEFVLYNDKPVDESQFWELDKVEWIHIHDFVIDQGSCDTKESIHRLEKRVAALEG